MQHNKQGMLTVESLSSNDETTGTKDLAGTYDGIKCSESCVAKHDVSGIDAYGNQILMRRYGLIVALLGIIAV